MFPEVPEDLSGLSEADLAELHTEAVAAFNEAVDSAASDEDVANLSAQADNIDRIRAEQAVRDEAATQRSEQLAEIKDRVNAKTEGEETEGETPEEGEDPEAEPEETPADDGGGEEKTEPEVPAEEKPVATEAPKAVAASGATVADARRRAPARTKPRPVAPQARVSVTAGAGIPGIEAGKSVSTSREIAELMVKRHDHLGRGDSDPVPVVTFNHEFPKDRHLGSNLSAEQVNERIGSFSTEPQSITAAGGLCAPVAAYYDQMIISKSGRPVRDALASFSADRGGIRYNPPPVLSELGTTALGRLTMTDDLNAVAKTCWEYPCKPAVEVDIQTQFRCMTFSNIGAKLFPEQVEAWTELLFAKFDSNAETFLLDQIKAGSSSFTTAGLVGAGRELFARLGQAAAGFRSRNRMAPDAPFRVLLPAWTLNLVEADFARTFTDETGFIVMGDDDVRRLFGTRGLNVTWYLDAPTGTGQVWGPYPARTVPDAATATNTALTSATAAFTSADVGRTVSGTGIVAGTKISTVTNGTTVVLDTATTATGTGVTVRIGAADVLPNYPTTVYAYMYPEGTWLHLDGGTLDLGLVRDSTLNATNKFQVFAETWENVAKMGPDSMEIRLNLNPDGSYAAARSVTVPIVT